MTATQTLLEILSQKMTYLHQKQAVIAENVANVDTPGYKQLELQPFTFTDALKQTGKGAMGINVTDPRHIIPASMAGANARTFKTKGGDVSVTGNSVDLEGQMMEVSKTSADYQTVAALYHKITGLFKIALKGNSG